MESIIVRDHLLGEDLECRVVKQFELEGYGTMYIVDLPHVNSRLAVIQSEMHQFTPNDWQGPQPAEPSEIGEYKWFSQTGAPAIMLDGLPRVIQ